MKYKIYKFAGRWYGFCPYCCHTRSEPRWWQIRDRLQLHARDHLPVDSGH